MRLRFTIRDLLWLTLVVAALMGWHLERHRLAGELHRAEVWQQQLEAELARQTKEREGWQSKFIDQTVELDQLRQRNGKSEPQFLEVQHDWPKR